QPVAVRHETAPSGHVDLRLAPVERDSQVLREEVATPAIVIAAHQGDGDALGPQRLESRDRAEMAPRDHRPILEPEVEQVAVDEQRLAQVGDGFEELVERGLDGGWDLSQMGVGDDEHAGWHGPKLEAAPQRRKPRCCILPGVISTITLRVNYSETDQMGVVYHANYLIWFDRARTELMRETGVTYKELEQQGVYLAVSEVKVRYRAAARGVRPAAGGGTGGRARPRACRQRRPRVRRAVVPRGAALPRRRGAAPGGPGDRPDRRRRGNGSLGGGARGLGADRARRGGVRARAGQGCAGGRAAARAGALGAGRGAGPAPGGSRH